MATRNIYKYFGNYHLAIRGMFGRIFAGPSLPPLGRIFSKQPVRRAILGGLSARRTKGVIRKIGDN